MSIGAMVIELRVFNKKRKRKRKRKKKRKKKKKNMDKMGKLFFVIILPKIGILVKDLAHSLFLTCIVL